MFEPIPDVTRWELLLAREAITNSARTQLANAAVSGAVVRLCRGAYLDSTRWKSLDSDGKYRAIVQAVAATNRGELVFSHAAAAALWRLPWLGPWPSAPVDVVVDPNAGVGSTRTIRRHREAAGETVAIDGLLATTLSRTVADIARSSDFARAVVVADAALNKKWRTRRAAVAPPRLNLEGELERIAVRHGSARLRHVMEFADGGADSPGESVSRVTLARLGAPKPVLQQSFPKPDGGEWFVDFWWPEYRIAGEFDGRGKYLDPALRNGMSADEVVLAEKVREDEIRRRCAGFARWRWVDARDPGRLGARLHDAGLPIRRLQSIGPIAK